MCHDPWRCVGAPRDPTPRGARRAGGAAANAVRPGLSPYGRIGPAAPATVTCGELDHTGISEPIASPWRRGHNFDAGTPGAICGAAKRDVMIDVPFTERPDP